MIDMNLAREQLPENTVSLFDDIVKSRVLGASKQTNLIADMIISIVEDKSNSNDMIINKARIVSDYFLQTRGQNSRAIYNGICLIMKGFNEIKSDDNNFKNKIIEQVKNFKCSAIKDAESSAKLAADICDSLDSILVFDYSSTANRMIELISKRIKLYIPESRALNGGRPFLKSAVNSNQDVKFIPDTTMMEAMKKCDAAFIGAETLYPDGSVFNSIGSDILAVICKELNKPLYVVSQLIKVDIRAAKGFVRPEPMQFDYSIRLAENWTEEDKKGIDFKGIKLVKIESNKVSKIITEKGMFTPKEFYDISMEYGNDLERSIYVN